MIRVMLVDDEPLILEGLKHLIDWGQLGYEIVATARNGVEALEIAKYVSFDLLITDIKMPEKTGLELIAALNEREKTIRSIVLSGFQEFHFVKQGLTLGIENYLLKPINEKELISTLSHVKEKINHAFLKEESTLVLRDHSIWRWLVGKMGHTEFKQRMAFYPEVQWKFPLRIGLLKMEWDQHTEEELYRLQRTLEQETSAMTVVTPSGDLLFIWCGFERESDWGQERSRFQSVVTEAPIGQPFVFVHSEPISEIQCLYEVYREMEMKCELKLLLPERDHHMADQLTFKRESELIPPQMNITLEQDIFEHLANRHYQKVRKDLEHMLSESHCERNPIFLKSVLMEFFYRLKSQFIVQLPFDQYVQIVQQIVHVETTSEAMKMIDRCIDLLEDDHLQENEKNYSPIIQTVLQHIHQHFSQDLSLKTLGHSFHINPIYLGQLFQREVGCSFTKYLNQLRIDRAKKLLLNSYDRAGQIGKKVGYGDATYFYKQFKKYEAMTPTEWRKVHKHS
ncbi:response regulator transcription factor [Halalkalibacterium halodurans]|uniref:Two-component sensor response regulator n=1 Tax=Halalkalibacterium halodurans (strain ATCC BAA-125 / DSM 18197 / FERM 7344 / JCM 9153 / C-125) TaxID=272558 RepID=Q9KEQ6_HALH5|nr:response regulator transcription factor [Halalkalibacterium halodurans]MED4171472.1 response regulator transcription factor [Halalkalibacterium halodurans]BAB04512.1 two-component sensor response regulator [Halalkalibacterium halodurans C-125]